MQAFWSGPVGDVGRRDELLLDGRVDPDLAEVRVSALLVVGRDGDLHHEGPDVAVVQVAQVDRLPAGRLVQLLHLDLLPVMRKNGISYTLEIRYRITPRGKS